MTSESGLLTTRTERVVKELWNEVLRAPGVSSTNDNFFERRDAEILPSVRA